MRLQRVLVVIGVVVALVAAGVGYTYYIDVAAIRDSTVVMEDARLTALSFTQATLAIQVTISNPSSRDISDLTVSFALLVSEAFVGNGSFPSLTIPAHDLRTQELNVTIYFAELTSAVITAIQQGAFLITMQGIVRGRVMFGLTTFSQSFSSSYTFP